MDMYFETSQKKKKKKLNGMNIFHNEMKMNRESLSFS
jgi:hypothetical protein